MCGVHSCQGGRIWLGTTERTTFVSGRDDDATEGIWGRDAEALVIDKVYSASGRLRLSTERRRSHRAVRAGNDARKEARMSLFG